MDDRQELADLFEVISAKERDLRARVQRMAAGEAGDDPTLRDQWMRCVDRLAVIEKTLAARPVRSSFWGGAALPLDSVWASSGFPPN